MAYPFYPYYPTQYNSFNALQPMQNVGPMQGSVGQSGITWVSGLAEAQNYPIAPNNAVTLWDKTGTTVYVKQADATGRPAMKIYDLVERSEMPSESTSPSQDKLPFYATKSELELISDNLRGVDDRITAIKAEIESMKGDIYGIAGKKKRKVEEDE